MCNCVREIQLGFTPEKVPAGTHICMLYTGAEEREKTLREFMKSGILQGERVTCFCDTIDSAEMVRSFEEEAIFTAGAPAKKALSIAGARDTYLENNRFDPDRMISLLSEYYDASQKDGYPGARVCGEMVPEVIHVPGGERLIEYESRVTQFVQKIPLTTICLYDTQQFDGDMLMRVLEVHPVMVVGGALVENPFFITPEEYLKETW
jgi:hypothetical protein